MILDYKMCDPIITRLFEWLFWVFIAQPDDKGLH